MSKFFYDGKANNNNERGSGSIGTQKNLRLGTKKAPAQIRVKSEARKQEIVDVCAENKWFADISVDAEKEEKIRDLEILQSKTTAAVSTKQANRNDPCPCESGKKYKKCCGAPGAL